MSGGGGGGYAPSGPSGNCDIVEPGLPLSSPQKAVLATLKKGDQLQVVQVGPALEARTAEGKTAGTLTPQSLLELLDCMSKGRKYKATVTEIMGGHCEVEIRPA